LSKFDEDDIPGTHGELNGLLESAFFTPRERQIFIGKVRAFMIDKSIGLDLLR